MKNIQQTTLKLQKLRKGETLIYHRGHLPSDRKMSAVVEELATLVYSLASDVVVDGKITERAKIHLTQKMLGEPGSLCRKTEYMATGA